MVETQLAVSAIAGLSGWFLSRWLRLRNKRTISIKPDIIPKRKALISQNSRQLSIVSYNILAACNARPDVYKHASVLYLSWEYRWGRIKQQLSSIQADVVCLQEVGVDQWEEVGSFLESLGYVFHVQHKDTNSRNKATFSLAMAYLQSKFECTWSEIRSRTMALRLTPISANDGQGHQDIYIINVHLEGHPTKGLERINQMKSVLSRMERKQISEGCDPNLCNVIVCGDFNEGANGPVYEFLYRGRLAQGYTDPHFPSIEVTKQTVAHPYGLKEVYDSSKYKVPCTRKSTNSWARIDFIWCSQHLHVAGLRRVLEQEEWKILMMTDMPNRIHPSDHLPIAAVLEIPLQQLHLQQRDQYCSGEEIL